MTDGILELAAGLEPATCALRIAEFQLFYIINTIFVAFTQIIATFNVFYRSYWCLFSVA